MAPLVDSSVWVALFLDFDTQHAKATRTINALRGALHVPYCVIAEVATTLTYKHSKQLADNFIAYISDNQDIVIVNDDARDEMAFYQTIVNGISFADAALIFLARERALTLVTFDRELERLARTILGR